MVFLLNKEEHFQKVHQIILQHKYAISLVLVNLITNYLFILKFKFYSDDWSAIVHSFVAPVTYSDLLRYPDRPIYYVILKFQEHVFQDTAIFYHIFGFITTSIILILIYYIAKKIFLDFGYPAEIYPFLAALIYCVMFNKDEMYPWALVALGFYSIVYLVSFYAYINKEKDHYLTYSLIAYTLGIFTYESGIAIPVVFFAYDILLKEDYKKSFLFAIPLLINLIVRKTAWFGYGITGYERGFGEWGVQSIFHNVFDFVSASLFIIIRQILYALHGLQALGYMLIIIAIVNLAILFVLYKQIDLKNISRCRNGSLVILFVIITLGFSFPFILRGGLLSGSLPTRSFEFIDIGIAFLLVFLVANISKPRLMKVLVLVFIGICIFLCQGLYMNWVISGDIQNDVYHYIEDHAGEIQSFDYVYFNTTSYVVNRPNAIDESIFYPVAKIYYLYIRHDTQALEQRIQMQTQRTNDLKTINEYDRYYNAKGLDNYALASMLAVKTEKFNDDDYSDYLIYGKSSNVPVEVTRDYIIIQSIPGAENITINRSRIYEIDYDMVYPNRNSA